MSIGDNWAICTRMKMKNKNGNLNTRTLEEKNFNEILQRKKNKNI